MNTPEAYARHLDRRLPQAQPTPEPDRTRPSVAWVRPSELPTLVGAPWIRRGIDLQSELTRRARRTPRTRVARAGRRISRTAIARPEAASPTATPTEELEL